MRDILKLFYRPEDVVMRKIKAENYNYAVLAIIILVTAMVWTAINMNNDYETYSIITSSGLGYVAIFFSWIIAVFGIIMYIILFSVMIMFIGYMVGGKAGIKEIIISQVYMLTPIAVFKFTTFIMYSTFSIVFVNDIDSSANFDIFKIISDFILFAYYIYLSTKVISKIQSINIKKAILNNIIPIVLLLIVALDTFKVVSNYDDYRNGQKNFQAEKQGEISGDY